jgi:hypothetical protein
MTVGDDQLPGLAETACGPTVVMSYGTTSTISNGGMVHNRRSAPLGITDFRDRVTRPASLTPRSTWSAKSGLRFTRRFDNENSTADSELCERRLMWLAVSARGADAAG